MYTMTHKTILKYNKRSSVINLKIHFPNYNFDKVLKNYNHISFPLRSNKFWSFEPNIKVCTSKRVGKKYLHLIYYELNVFDAFIINKLLTDLNIKTLKCTNTVQNFIFKRLEARKKHLAITMLKNSSQNYRLSVSFLEVQLQLHSL